MRLFLLTVGRIQEPYLREGMAAYQRRLEAFVRIEWRQFDGEPIPKKLRPADVKQAVAREGDRLLAALAGLPAGTHRIALALRGRAFT
ncbi:MAG TPA: 23S rRNA (pseudouridine(1915)-N(3))-methyltransferase RlmH, partial [Bacillota bacterium]